MEHPLSNGKKLIFDPNEVLPNDRNESMQWLLERFGKNESPEEAMEEKDLVEYSASKLYDFKDRLAEMRRGVRYVRSPEAAHTRQYCKAMKGKVDAELKRRGLPTTRPDDRRVYGPGGAEWQRAGGKA